MDSGKLDKAVQHMDKEYAIAEKKNDAAAMAADLQAKGNIITEMQRYDAAQQEFDRSLQVVEGSTLSQAIKDNAKLLHHFNLAALAPTRPKIQGRSSSPTNWLAELLSPKGTTTPRSRNLNRRMSRTPATCIA